MIHFYILKVCFILILVEMHELAACGEIVGLPLSSWKQFLAQSLEDDSFLFLKVVLDNIAKSLEVQNYVCIRLHI